MAFDPTTLMAMVSALSGGNKGGGGDPDPLKRNTGFAEILSGVFKGGSAALGGGKKAGPSRRQIDENTTLKRQAGSNQALQQLAQLLLRSGGRGGF